MPLFIDDGCTLTRTIAARPGLHPEAVVVYRPALAKERHVYSAKVKAGDAAGLDAYETELIAKQVVTINDEAAVKEKGKAARLHPAVRSDVIDLLLSFAPGDVSPEERAGN